MREEDGGNTVSETPPSSTPRIIAVVLALGAAAALGLVLAPTEEGPGESGSEASGDDATSADAPATLYPDIPRIDVHVHVAPTLATQAVEMLRQNEVEVALNASGGVPGMGLELSLRLAEETGGRIRPYCNMPFRGIGRPTWGEEIRQMLRICKDAGAVGLKIAKSLGLGVRTPEGELLTVDDPRLDPVFEAAGEFGLPVLIHAGDPQAFFLPPNEDNERYAELSAHPGWSFYGDRPDGTGSWPSWESVFAQYERRVARHPGTKFLGAHFGNAPEEPARVRRMLERYDNLFIETAARVPEIGRHDAAQMRRFFTDFADRILFGTDLGVTSFGLTLGSSGEESDSPEALPGFFRAHWRYFETEGRGMQHPTPIQGDWTIDGLGLPREVLERVYYRNAQELFGIQLPE